MRLGELPLVCRFLKGVFNLRTTYPRYFPWDVSVVLRYIKSLEVLKQCDLKSLSCCLGHIRQDQHRQHIAKGRNFL